MKTIKFKDLEKVSGGAVSVYLEDKGYREELTNGSELSVHFPKSNGGFTYKSDGMYFYDKTGTEKASPAELTSLKIKMSTSNGCTTFSHLYK